MRFILFFLSIPAFLFSQTTYTKETLPNSDPAHWQRLYNGRMDDVSDIEVGLEKDGAAYKGHLVYKESGDRFRLEGVEKNGLLLLTEWDTDNRKTGSMEAVLEDSFLTANWTNHDGSIGAFIEMEAAEVQGHRQTQCNDNKWVNRYKSQYGGAAIDLVLSKTGSGQIWGTLWIEAEQMYLDLKGDISEGGQFSAQLSSQQNSQIKGSLKGDLSDVKNIKASVVFPNNQKQAFDFSFAENMLVGCRNYADYSSTYDIIFPKTKCSSCNVFIEKQVDKWLDVCKKKMRSKNIQPHPQNRAAIRASCWTEIHLWDERYISGLLVFGSTWDSTVQVCPFSFDLTKNKTLDLEALFQKKFNYYSWLGAYALKESPKLPHWNNSAYQTWVRKEGFPNLTMRQDGFLLSTTFHPVFGRSEVLVPWIAVKPYLRKSAVRDLVLRD